MLHCCLHCLASRQGLALSTAWQGGTHAENYDTSSTVFRMKGKNVPIIDNLSLLGMLLTSKLNFGILQSFMIKQLPKNWQVLRIVEYISSGFYPKREKTVAVFFDVAKAFDKVWHAGLVYKLYKLDVPVAPVFLLFLIVGAEKIELQDIEEDNLKSEKEKDIDKSEPRTHSASPGTGPGLLPFEFLKNGFLRYFESPTHHGQAPQQQRYVQQYAVSEAPERAVVTPKVQYAPPAPQQAMVGYLSNVPMQIYLVPQYYNEQPEQATNAQPAVQYVNPAVAKVTYPTAPEAVQTQSNYVEVPTYVTPTGKSYVQQFAPPVAYVQYTAQPTIATAHATVAPVLAYQPVMQYPTAIAAPPVETKAYYENTRYHDGNTVEEIQETGEEIQKHYQPTEVPYTKTPEFPRYYNSRTPIREEYRHSAVSELPPPNPLLIKAPPPHLAHIPKALPVFSRPLPKNVFPSGSSHGYTQNTQRPFDGYVQHYKRRPTSLLDSYIPSSVQIEYLKRGYTKDPLVAYEQLSSGHHFSQVPAPIPRHYERGFLPNQMYHTAAGGVTYGHYKRTPKIEKISKK
ncbi:LOW QUALITY PROTEIN: uncharacterized protein ACR2FA_003882 [Aphomia sociella]